MNLAQMLEDEEGRERSAYQDSLGYWTIGIGRLVDARKGGGLADEEIDYLLANDIKRKTLEVAKALPWISTLNDARQGVLVGMAFQLGTAGLLTFKNTLAKIQAGDFEGAAENMRISKWATQTPERAKRMAEQMRTGSWQH